jgi:hypothetical protein
MEYAEENNARAPCVIVNDSTRKAKMEEEVKMQDAVVLLGAVREKVGSRRIVKVFNAQIIRPLGQPIRLTLVLLRVRVYRPAADIALGLQAGVFEALEDLPRGSRG